MNPQHPPRPGQTLRGWPAVWGVLSGGHYSFGAPPFSLGCPVPSATPRCEPVPTSVWGARLLEVGLRLLGGVGRLSQLDVELRGKFWVLANTLLSTVSRSRQTVFALIGALCPGSASLSALNPLVLWHVLLQLGSAPESERWNPHLAWWASNWLRIQYWSKWCSTVLRWVLTVPIPFEDNVSLCLSSSPTNLPTKPPEEL
jgi:hypothetical protein